MGLINRIKNLIKKDKEEEERPPGIPAPPSPDYWARGRRDDLSRFDLSARARKDIAKRRAAKEAMDKETMRQFYKSFGVDEEDP